MRIGIFILAIITAPFIAYGFQAKKAFKDLEKNDWEKAEQSILKGLEKDSLDPAAFHAYSILLSDSRAPQFDIDKAAQYNSLAKNGLSQEDEKGLERLQKMGVTAEDLDSRKEIIDSLAFIIALQKGTEGSFNHFIDLYPESRQKPKAIAARNKIAYEDAENKNSVSAFRNFLNKYPESEEADKAIENLNKLIYEQQAKDADLNQMITFLKENPDNPFRSEVELKVFKEMTGFFSSRNLNRFIALFPESPYSKISYNFLYHIEKDSMDIKQFLNTYSLFPNPDSLANLEKKERGFLLPVIQNNKVGFVNNKGEEAIDTKFTDNNNKLKCNLITTDIFQVKEGDSIKLFNRNGNLIFLTVADSITDLGSGFLRVSKQGKQGLVHKSGFVFFNPEYREIEPLLGSLFRFRKGTSWGIMNAYQKVVLNDEFTSIHILNGNILLNKNGRIGIFPLSAILEKKSNSVLEFPYEDVEEISDGLYLCSIDDSEALLDQNLKEIIPLQDQEIIQVGDNWFAARDSLSVLYSPVGNNLVNNINDYVINSDNFAYKFKGKWFLYPGKTSYDSIKFLSSTVYVTTNKSKSLAHFSGKKTISLANTLSYKWVISSYENDFQGFFLSQDKDHVKRLYDSSGKKILAGWFDEVNPLSEFLFQIEDKKLKGLSDSTGRNVLPIEYDGIGKYIDGNVSLLKKGRFGIFNYPRRVVIEPEYDRQLKSLDDSLFIAFKDKKCGIINFENKEILPFEYGDLSFWSPGKVLAKTGDERWIISLSDNVSVPIKDISKVSTLDGKTVSIYETPNGYGIFDPEKGNIIPDVFTNLSYLKKNDAMVYVAGQYLSETDLWVIAYFDPEGKLVWRSAVTEGDYNQYLCK